MTMIENVEQLQNAIRAVVAYNWQSEKYDYEECLDPDNANSTEGHIFLTLRDLAIWLGDDVPPLPAIEPEVKIETAGMLRGGTPVWTISDFGEGPVCDECGATFPENTRTVEGKWHETSCSLFAESVAPTLEERLTDESFADREPGSVSEDEYQSRLSEIQEAADYLRNESVWRVEYNRAWWQTPRVNYVEATEEDARGDESQLPLVREPYSAQTTQVRIVSCRRATVGEDLPAFVEDLAREGWYR